MWDKGSLHELIEAKITDYPDDRGRQPRAFHSPL